MKSTNRTKFSRPVAKVRPSLIAGAGRWLLLFCERGHILRQIPRGEWSDARRKYSRKNAIVKCARCAKEVEDVRT